MFDSDCIFFRKPKEIIQWVESKSDNPIFMSDGRDVYIISRTEARHCFGLGLVSSLNSGLIGFNTKIVTLNFVEKFFKVLFELDISGKRMWLVVEQTVLGVLLSKKELRKKLVRLPKTYLVSILEKQIPNLVCRHYVKPIRAFFYPQAIYTLKQIASEEKNQYA